MAKSIPTATLDEAGLLEREPAAGREVCYRLREGALAPASAWLREAEAAWDDRLGRLKQSVEAQRDSVRVSRDGNGGSDGTSGR